MYIDMKSVNFNESHTTEDLSNNDVETFETDQLKNGQLIVVKRANNNPFTMEDDPKDGTIGIFLHYLKGSKKYLPGLEPIEVLIDNSVIKLYRDEVRMIH